MLSTYVHLCVFEGTDISGLGWLVDGHPTIVNDGGHCLEEKEMVEYERVVKRKWLYCAVESPPWPAIPQAHTARHPFDSPLLIQIFQT